MLLKEVWKVWHLPGTFSGCASCCLHFVLEGWEFPHLETWGWGERAPTRAFNQLFYHRAEADGLGLCTRHTHTLYIHHTHQLYTLHTTYSLYMCVIYTRHRCDICAECGLLIHATLYMHAHHVDAHMYSMRTMYIMHTQSTCIQYITQTCNTQTTHIYYIYHIICTQHMTCAYAIHYLHNTHHTFQYHVPYCAHIPLTHNKNMLRSFTTHRTQDILMDA